MRWKRRDGRLESCAVIGLLAAIAAIFRRKHKLLLRWVEIARRPSVVAALLEHQHALCGKLCTLLRRVEFRPILVQLITAVFGDVQAPCGVKVETLTVSDACGIAFFGRKDLMRLIGVVTPDAGANLELGARVVAARMRHAVLLLASICGRSHRYKKITMCIDGEGMHGVVAIKRHAAKDRLGLGGGCRLALLQGVANDAIADLGIKPIIVQNYARNAVAITRNGRTKSVVHI